MMFYVVNIYIYVFKYLNPNMLKRRQSVLNLLWLQQCVQCCILC